VSVSPDTGQVRLGVQVTNEDADTALEEANETIDAVTAAIQELGIEEDDITTGSFSIWPEYDYENDRQEVVGYRVNHIVSVKVRDIGLTGDVVSTGVDAGANSVETVSFIVEDESEALDQARERAFDNAREKAEKLAELSDGALGPVLNVSEQTHTPGPVEREVPEEAEDEDAGSVPFNPDDTIVSVDIQVSWELQ
ncbi:MAG: SIMPL domain-containing protein, partial [Chloroflexota bacterium]